MADLTIRQLPEELHAFLRQRAAANHRSVNRETIALIEAAMKNAARAKPRFTADEVMAMTQRFAELPVLDDRSANEIIGYDENGLPK